MHFHNIFTIDNITFYHTKFVIRVYYIHIQKKINLKNIYEYLRTFYFRHFYTITFFTCGGYQILLRN